MRAALDGRQSAIVLVDDLSAAAEFSNAYGPEHLELQTADPDALLDLIENAGAIFLGEYAPVSLGDYLAGSNHVLPTGGQARFSAGLGAATFLRSQQVIRYDRDGLRDGRRPHPLLLGCRGAARARRCRGCPLRFRRVTRYDHLG